MADNDRKAAEINDSHTLGKLHLEAATSELGKGNTDQVLFHLSTAQELLRPSSHRHAEITEAIRRLNTEHQKIGEPLTSLELELTIEQAAEQLEAMFELKSGETKVIRMRHFDGNFWELDAFFAGPRQLHFVTVTHAAPGAIFPLLYFVTDHYSREAWYFSSFSGCLDKIAYLTSV